MLVAMHVPPLDHATPPRAARSPVGMIPPYPPTRRGTRRRVVPPPSSLRRAQVATRRQRIELRRLHHLRQRHRLIGHVRASGTPGPSTSVGTPRAPKKRPSLACW